MQRRHRYATDRASLTFDKVARAEFLLERAEKMREKKEKRQREKAQRLSQKLSLREIDQRITESEDASEVCSLVETSAARFNCHHGLLQAPPAAAGPRR